MKMKKVLPLLMAAVMVTASIRDRQYRTGCGKRGVRNGGNGQHRRDRRYFRGDRLRGR